VFFSFHKELSFIRECLLTCENNTSHPLAPDEKIYGALHLPIETLSMITFLL
jgi:hypothetical protein